MAATRQPTVLMGDFGEVAGLGIREVLDEEGLVLLAEQGPPERLMQRLRRDCPEVVLLDLDQGGVRDAAQAVARDFPGVTVIACSSEESCMRVFPPCGGEPEEHQLTPHALVRAVRSA